MLHSFTPFPVRRLAGALLAGGRPRDDIHSASRLWPPPPLVNRPFGAVVFWEVQPGRRWCLDAAGIGPQDLDAVAYSHDRGAAPSGAAIAPGSRRLYPSVTPFIPVCHTVENVTQRPVSTDASSVGNRGDRPGTEPIAVPLPPALPSPSLDGFCILRYPPY